MEKWVLSFGWTRSTLDRWGNRKELETRPSHIETTVFHSLEAALKHPSRGSWWEITSPDGRVVVSSYKRFDEEAIPPLSLSLCARQILNTRYPGSFPDAKTIGVDVGFDSASHDDGVTWEPVLLRAKNPSATKNGHQKPRAPMPLTVLSVESCTDPPNSVIIRHTSGRVTIRCDKLEIRETAKGMYRLTILDPESGHSKGIYGLVDFDTVITANLLGVRLVGKDKGEDSNGHNRLPKT